MRYMALAFPLVILIDCIMFVSFFAWQQQALYEFDQRQMDLWTNYAADAAVQEMLANGTHLGTDYATWGEMVVEPELALDVYMAVLIRNLGWADTDRNRLDLIETSMPFFCVAAYDGYYMYSRQHEVQEVVLSDGTSVENTIYEMRWSPKLPYSETLADGSGYVYYFYNLGESEYGTYKESDSSRVKYDNVLSRTSTGSGSLSRSRAVVNNTLTNACNSALYTGLEGNVDAEIYIPSSFSAWSNSNPVMSPSVLVYMSRPDQRTNYDVVTFGIGGSKIDDAQFCICYEYNGQKLYTWSDKRKEVIDRGSSIERVVTSPEEAACAGYYFDFTLTR